MYQITISRPINGITINRDEFLLREDGEALVFPGVIEALRYLAGYNYRLEEILELNFNIEEVGLEAVSI